MYIVSLIVPVPEQNQDAYRAWAQNSAGLLMKYGCLEVIEAWEDEVPDGKLTDFRRAVAAQPGEKIVQVLQVWPDRASVKDAERRMDADGAFEHSGEVPFDASRLIYGGFLPLHVAGRS